MNEYLEAILLGIVQGITEFIPVSSDGHLELAKWLLGDSHTAAESFMMTIILHFGTMFAILWVFRFNILDIIKKLPTPDGRKFVLLVIISMIPAVIVGVGFEDVMVSMFNQKISLVALFLIINGIVLISSDFFTADHKKITPIKAMCIGIAQAIAILPGISRSGSTIATSLALGIDRKEAANFSFIIVLPLLFGKLAKDLMDGSLESTGMNTGPLVAGFFVSLIVGIFACKWMLVFVAKAKLRYFGIYCIAIGLIALALRLWVLKG